MEIFFPTPKTELELAVAKIKSQNLVRNFSLTPTDPVNGKYFAIGKIKYTYSSIGVDHMDVTFSKNDTEVMIKYKKEIIYFFNDPNEVKAIREAIIECHTKMLERQRKEKVDEFNSL